LWRLSLATLVGCAACAAHHAAAQNAPRPRRAAQPADAPNVAGEADAAAMSFVDSLFAPFAPADPLPQVGARALGLPTGRGLRPTWSARLARNPHPEDGNAPYVLIDRYGGIQRYVEPVASVDLDRHVGQTVAVRRDTGGTLLASQLDLPRSPAMPGVAAAGASTTLAQRAAGARPASPGVAQAAYVAPAQAMEPTPADDAPMPPTGPLPTPSGSSVDGEAVEGQAVGEGPLMYDGYQGGYEAYEGQIIDEHGNIVADGGDALYLDGASELGGYGGCPLCGDRVCGGRGCTGCGFGSRPVFYARGEYLNWWFDGMPIPPLVVNADIGPGTPPALLNPRVVFGNDDVLDDDRSGARITLGYFLDDYGKWGIEGDYITFGTESLTFQDGGDGTVTYVGRPYIDATTGLPAVEDVALVDVITGTVTVNIDSRFQSAGLRFRRNLCCVAGNDVACGDCVSCGSGAGMGGCASCQGVGAACPVCPLVASKLGRFINGGTRHVDILYGVRWAELKEGLGIAEDLVAADETTFLINEAFNASNQFFGGEIGFAVDWQRRRWSLEFLSKLAIGSTRQRVSISGQTIRDGELFANRSLLANDGNIGDYQRDQFSVIPEIGFTAGYALTERLRLVAGYTLLYWTRVARPGDQIDLRVNPAWLDLPSDPSTVNPANPEFVFRDSDIWAQGFSIGADYRW
jgi:hypothetical protein